MATQDSSTTAARRIRLGMVGGGRDAFIGGVHRIASRIDDRYELVAGAFSSTPEKSKASAADLGVAPDRAYGDYVEMAKREARLKSASRRWRSSRPTTCTIRWRANSSSAASTSSATSR
jgi:hypothetical protein